MQYRSCTGLHVTVDNILSFSSSTFTVHPIGLTISSSLVWSLLSRKFIPLHNVLCRSISLFPQNVSWYFRFYTHRCASTALKEPITPLSNKKIYDIKTLHNTENSLADWEHQSTLFEHRLFHKHSPNNVTSDGSKIAMCTLRTLRHWVCLLICERWRLTYLLKGIFGCFAWSMKSLQEHWFDSSNGEKKVCVQLSIFLVFFKYSLAECTPQVFLCPVRRDAWFKVVVFSCMSFLDLFTL